jgi:hypothetical protein
MSESHENVLSHLKADLTQPRALSQQVETTIADRHACTLDQLHRFFTEILPTLDDVDLDLTFSPLFTPTLADKARYAGLLSDSALSPQQLDEWIDTLTEQGLLAPLQTQTGETFSFPVSWVSIDRWVKRLGLTQPIAPSIYAQITILSPEADLPTALVLVKEAVWQGAGRTSLLTHFLQAFQAKQSFKLDELAHLTDLVRTYRPASLADLERQLRHLIASCESDLAKVGGDNIHHPMLKDKYVTQHEGADSLDIHAQEATKTYMGLIRTAEALLTYIPVSVA